VTVAPAPPSRIADRATKPGYVPQRHPGTPDRWTPATILAGLRRWVDETGSAPRRNDWCGQEPERAGAAQRKWMDEHPRWPSSSCVAAHFGSWSAALEAADLPARKLTYETSVAERVEAARRMSASGRTLREISETVGVSISTVCNYLRARRCPTCGGPLASPNGSRCRACTASEPTVARTWTRVGVLMAIADWESFHGRAPSYRDWTPSRTAPGRWEAESPRWPSASVVCDLYAEHPEPWNAALRDAGVGIRHRRWSDDAIRAALAAFWTRTGRRPAPADLDGPAWRGPCAHTLHRRFGGLDAAWRELSPTPDPAAR
jgi:hypothetical protein